MNNQPPRKTTQDDFVKTALRVPPELHSALLAEAQANLRSLNSEILFRLQQNPLEEVRRQNAEILTLLRRLLERG